MDPISNTMPPTFAEKDLNYYLRMIRGDFAELEENEPQMARVGGAPFQKNIVLLIGSAGLGTGNEELGRRLLKHFLAALLHQRSKPRSIILLNGAVRLATEESEALQKLILLEEQGIKILTCVVSVDEFDLEESLKVGAVADMDLICEHLLSAWKVITL
jgi:selenium metabolism protein YedF